ncbi:MAG: AAA-like domain-containing protein [Desulfobacterales bacterium]|nr:AAA-like domain-containing protein [Desulfobacterales bacterium]
MKKFNYTGVCIPEKHYMVNISNKLSKIMEMIEEGEYFTINRPRQYGKTTTLDMLERTLPDKDYLAILISFEGVGDLMFQDEIRFSKDFLEILSENILSHKNLSEYLRQESGQVIGLRDISKVITSIVQKTEKKIVLMIDEVDKSSNNQLFLNFLGMLRNKYLNRNKGKNSTFHSVILAGVHDVKSLKLKIRSTDEQKYNSPWNIAVDFKVDLSFSPEEIRTMLDEYRIDKNVKIDAGQISEKLYYYTSGYPFLVSKLCRIIDDEIMHEKKEIEWTEKDVEAAVQIILKESNTNFDSLIKNLENNEKLYQTVYQIIIEGLEKTYNIHNPVINMGIMYGIFRENYKVKIHNRIYEQLIYNYLSSKLETSMDIGSYNFRNNFLQADGYLDFSKILIKFQEFMRKEYSERDISFLERNGRLIFLAFLKPVINGKGYDFKEVQISEEKRLDVVVTYLERRYVVELKVWHGPEAHAKGILQLKDYIDRIDVNEGYLIIYDFRGKKEWKQEQIMVENKEIFMIWV